MEREQTFYKSVLKIALPVTLQSLLQSSFGVADQVMAGQLGSSSIAGIGLGGKFSSVYSVLISAVAAAAGIMIAQYMGKRDGREVGRSFGVSLLAAMALALVFTGVCIAFPGQIMEIYTKDDGTGQVAAGYLRIVAFSYIPMAAEALLATLLRCMEAASLPLYASVFGAMVNTGLNYVLIFGRFGFPQMGVNGAAWATVVSRIAGCALCIILFWFYYGRYYRKKEIKLEVSFRMGKCKRVQYMGILLPILLCELFWSLGENVYTAIYGNMGTQACAAMTLTVPVQALMIGTLSGIAQAAGILIGKFLGGGEYEKAYQNSKKLMGYGLAGSALLSIILVAAGRLYVQIYQVEDTVKILGNHILTAFALISPVKVQNMILGGGVLRSGGKTKYVMVIDFVGTWFFGVPLGLLAAFVWKLEIPYVYFILSLEECVRFFISVMVFRRRTWMKNISVLHED